MKLNAIIGIIILSVAILILAMYVYLEIEGKTSSAYSIFPPIGFVASGILFLLAVRYLDKNKKEIKK